MEDYLSDIRAAIFIYPFVVIASLVPFVLYHYLRYGYVQRTRALVFYSFLFYGIAALFMVLLPLPEVHPGFCEERAASTRPRLLPFLFVRDMVRELSGHGLSLRFWRTHAFLVTALNVVLTIPLGFYLRYLYGLSWKQALGVGFGVSLFFELTQLTGIYGLYPCPYRLFEVDDLLTNTTGAGLGFWLAGHVGPLPDVDPDPPDRSMGVTSSRRFLAFVADWALLFVLDVLLLAFLPDWQGVREGALLVLTLPLAYFILFTGLWDGRTPGKRLLGIHLRDGKGQKAGWAALAIRYAVLLGWPLSLIELHGYLGPETPLALKLLPALGLLLWVMTVPGPELIKPLGQGLHDRISGTRNQMLS